MAVTTVERWIGGIGLVSIVSAGVWLGSLETRVAQLEKQGEDLALGPRGQSCQLIVQRLVQRPTDRALHSLADKWGCSMMAAATEEIDPDAPPPAPPTPLPELPAR